MKPIFDQARAKPKRLVYAEGEERRVLQAAQQVIDEGLAFPILVGRADVIERRIDELSLRMRPGENFELVNILQDERFLQLLEPVSRHHGPARGVAASRQTRGA